jgi:hypothetical protein
LRLKAASRITSGEVLTAKNASEPSIETTKLIFTILSEITERAKLVLDLQNLKRLVEVSGTLHFLRAENTIGDRKEQTQEISKRLIELEQFLDKSLDDMMTEVSSEVTAADHRLVETLEVLANLEALSERYASLAEHENRTRMTWNVMLAIVCVVEFLYYAVFFCVKRHQTRNFKID